MPRLVSTTALLCLFASIAVAVQGPPTNPDMAIDAATRMDVIDSVVKELTDYYVFPDVGAKMVQSIRERQRRGDYDSISTGQRFAEVLTAHLREQSRDRHLVVRYSATVVPQFLFPSPPPPEAISPVTHTDWEGTGVEPDIKVPAAQALNMAHPKALEKIAPTTVDSARTEVLSRLRG